MQDDRRPAQESGLSTDNLAATGSDGHRPGLSGSRTGHAVFPGEATGDTEAQQTSTPTPGAGADTSGGTRGDIIRDEGPTRWTEGGEAGAGAAHGVEPRLLDAAQEKEIRDRWQTIQTGFVDEPRDTVQAADALVAELMQRTAALFAERRQELEDRWNRGEQVDTEDLRLALQQYRSFFNRLLTT